MNVRLGLSLCLSLSLSFYLCLSQSLFLCLSLSHAFPSSFSLFILSLPLMLFVSSLFLSILLCCCVQPSVCSLSLSLSLLFSLFPSYFVVVYNDRPALFLSLSISFFLSIRSFFFCYFVVV
jgi:hypothetical protein